VTPRLLPFSVVDGPGRHLLVHPEKNPSWRAAIGGGLLKDVVVGLGGIESLVLQTFLLRRLRTMEERTPKGDREEGCRRSPSLEGSCFAGLGRCLVVGVFCVPFLSYYFARGRASSPLRQGTRWSL